MKKDFFFVLLASIYELNNKNNFGNTLIFKIRFLPDFFNFCQIEKKFLIKAYDFLEI